MEVVGWRRPPRLNFMLFTRITRCKIHRFWPRCNNKTRFNNSETTTNRASDRLFSPAATRFFVFYHPAPTMTIFKNSEVFTLCLSTCSNLFSRFSKYIFKALKLLLLLCKILHIFCICICQNNEVFMIILSQIII